MAHREGIYQAIYAFGDRRLVAAAVAPLLGLGHPWEPARCDM